MSDASRRVFDGNLLRATLWQPSEAHTLYITFRQRLPAPGQFDDPGPVRQALSRGFAHLYLQSRWNDWYLNTETTALEAALSALRARFDRAWAIGYSMGGYGALRLARALRLDRALLVSPQVTLDPRVIPGETRYPEGPDFDPVLGDLGRVPCPGLSGVVAFDPFRPLDRAHARLAASLFPGLRLAPLGFGGHPATGVLREAGAFRSLQGLSLGGDLTAAAVTRLHRDLRAGSARYWQNRAAACRGAGRPVAACTAEARLAVLE